MKERVDPDRSHELRRILTLTAILALLLALLVLGFYYGCAKEVGRSVQLRRRLPQE